MTAGFRSALLVILAAAGLCAASAYFYLQHSLRGAIEQQVGERLGTGVQVGFARITLFPPGVQLAGITVRNPDGFDSRDFLKTQRIHMAIASYDHGARLLDVPQMTFHGMEIWIEHKGRRGNHRVIQDNLRRFDRRHGVTRADKTKFIIHELRIQGLTAYVQSGSHDRVTDVPEIVLRDVGAGRDGVTLGELAGVITDAALRAALRSEVRRELDERIEEEAQELRRKLDELFD